MNNLTFQKPGSSPRFALRVSLIWAFLVHFALAQTVATPTFLPVAGTSLTKFNVLVTCATAGATIRYTVTDADPTVYDPSVVSGGTVTVAQNMTLKAKAFNGADFSTVASTTFDLTGDLSAGSQFTLAMVTNGQVYGWGNQDFGRLSNNSTATTNILAPAVAKYSSSSNISNATRIAAGAKHSIMLDSTGTVWGFGNNLLGEAGKTSPSELLYAAKVTSNSGGTTFLTTCTEIAAGLDFSAALETGGFVATWGSQASGRLGNGSTATGSRKFSGRVKTSSTVNLSGIRDIALGKDFALAREACALETPGALGTVWIWGNNASGNLALGSTTAQSYAIRAKLNSGATAYITDAWDLDAGDNFAAVVRWKNGDPALQGSVWTFGSRVGGRLGDNGVITGTATYPVQIQKLVGSVYSQLTGITQVSCGPGHTLALDDLGNVWAWGSNSTGALGDNTVIDKKYAVKVRNPSNTADLSNIARVSAGGINGSPAFSTAVAKDGTIYVWGSNANGLQANGTTSTTVFAKLPVVVAQLKTIPGFPTVSLASSVTTALAPGAATLTATVADPLGAANIQKTEFFLQGALNTTKTAAPWSVALSSLASGSYHSYAKTTDLDGNITTSLPTTFTINFNFNPDTDADGLFDSWETTHFGNLTQTTTGDSDGDGLTNLTEFTNGTNPQDYYNGLVPTLAIASGNNQSISFPEVTPQALVFTVKDSGGTALANAPVTLTITAPAANNGTIAPSASGPFTLTTLSLTSNAQGQASAYYKSPTTVIGPVTLTLSLRNTPVVATTTASVQVVNPDIDGDGLLDSWENTNFGNLTQTPTGDPDGDKVTNLNEFTAGTNPNSNTDANADGIPDDWVTWRLSQVGGVAASTLPPAGDPDQDELTNLVEFQNNTNPRLLDSDVDTQSDWQELAQGSDPNDVASLINPLAVSAHQGTSNLRITQTLPNLLTPANSYNLSLTGNIPPVAGFEMKSSNIADGPAYEWIEIKTTGENLTAFKTNRDAIAQRPIGFLFPFYGATYQNVFICGHGFVRLTPTPGYLFGSGAPLDFMNPLPNPNGHTPLISPYQQYMTPDVLGDIYFQAFPSYVVIQWEQVKLANFDIRPTFQAVLYQDGSIRFNYKSIPPTPGNANLLGYLSGIQNEAGDSGIAASFYAGAQNGLALHILDPISLRFAAPSTAAPWVTTTATTASGNPLSWELSFQASGLQPGNHQATLELRKAGGPVLYSRALALTVLPFGTAGNDTMVGTSGDDVIGGLAGNDSMTGMAGNDTLDGGTGDDSLTGGVGNDQLAGGDGKDAYYYNLGDGNDTLSDNAGIHQLNDTTADYSDLYFGAGITPGMIKSSFLSVEGAMKFEILGANPGSVTIGSWNTRSGTTNVFTSSRWRFSFTDGTVWNGKIFGYDYVRPALFSGFTGGAANDLLVGTAVAESIRGLIGNDLLQGGEGWDNYYYQWGDGNDTIEDIPVGGQLSIVNIHGAALDGLLTYDFQAPDSLRINVTHPADLTKSGSVLLKGWYQTTPFVARDNWRLYVENAAGALVDISQTIRFMATNGPDVIQLPLVHNTSGLTFSSGAGNDTIQGSFYGETINGDSGDDFLYGNSGIDWLDGGDGNDTLNGGADRDTLLGGNGDDLLGGDAGDDDLIGGDRHDVLNGGDGNDILDGGAGDDVLMGEAGNDTLRGGSGNDELNGGSGSDLYEWNLGDGHDVVTDTLHESAPAIENQLHFGTGVVYAQLFVSPGPDKSLIFSLRNGANEEIGSVTISNWFARNDVVTGTGNHSKTWRIHFDGGSTVWDGRFMSTSGPDILAGTTGSDSLQGGADRDTLQGLGGEDTLAGGEGNDTLEGGDGNDDLAGGDGRDVMSGGNGNDILKGDAGSDTIDGNAGDDHLYGDTGNDVLTGGGGVDTYHWAVGDGNDTLVEHPSSNVPEEINTISFGGEVALGVELSSQHVKITSTNSNYGFFTVFDPAGNQIALLTVRNWNETKGKWRVRFPQDQEPSSWTGLAELVNPDLEGVYDIDPDAGTVGGAINGTDYNDFMVGGTGDDILSGLVGNDQISGQAGKDVIYGGIGSDIISGGEGNDRLLGGIGTDIIDGGSDNDSIQGGEDDDLLTGGRGDDLIDGGRATTPLMVKQDPTHCMEGPVMTSSKVVLVMIIFPEASEPIHTGGAWETVTT